VKAFFLSFVVVLSI